MSMMRPLNASRPAPKTHNVRTILVASVGAILAASRCPRGLAALGAVVCAGAFLSLGLLGASPAARSEPAALPAKRETVAPTTRPAAPVAVVAQVHAKALTNVTVDLSAARPAGAAPRASVAAPKAARARIVRMEVTAYCPCTKCCGPKAQGITASGLPVSYNGGRFVAADTRVLPMRTKLQIPGYHHARPVEVIDRGGAIKGNKLDVYYPTHAEALEWGRRMVNVTVVEE